MEFLKQCLRENHAIIHFYVVETAFFPLFATHAIQSYNESFRSVHEAESWQSEGEQERKKNGKQERTLANNSIERQDGNNVNDNVLAKFSCVVYFRVVASPADG